MSRSVAGFILYLYVCTVSGQQYPVYRLKGTPTDPSIAIGVISGGHYPAGSFSIGYGESSPNGDGGPGADYGVNNGNRGNGQLYPNGNTGPTQNEGGYVHGQNDINNYGQNPTPDQNTRVQYPAPNNDVPLQNPGRKPTHPYDAVYNQNNDVPVRNSASRNRFLPRILEYIFSYFW
ncbi:uncharacterized protein LOC118279220 [Spodoptera frugiperda]|uniref:Uncharacterized protein LOC118279220 n=1 Tax=Spodoptera frugiperda TaxID=7108 RepID=A0A9R0DI49_SPOFR|nr:uncharacterized protein LOC118279220 [Spodoptera frugiperda]